MSTSAQPRTELDQVADRKPTPELLAELGEANERLEGEDAGAILRYAVDRFGGGCVVASSFQDAVLIDLAVKVDRQIPVLFIDTGFHFPETLSYVSELEQLYGLNLKVLSPAIGKDVSPCGSPDCCEKRKVAPLDAALATYSCWATGLKRVDTPLRAQAPIISFDSSRGLVKVNPLAAWTDEDIDRYVDEHRLPRHPLTAAGYVSIGCAPTTRPVAAGENPREGRWPGSEKTECGLHL